MDVFQNMELFSELIQCGGKFDPHYFTRYLKEKYTALYQL